MKKYNWFQKLVKSIVPGEFYIHILSENMASAIAYMILLILVLSLSVGIYSGYNIKKGIDATASDYESGIIPPIDITDGELTMEGTDTVTIDHFGTQVVIDDDYNYDINDVLSYDDFILFQKNKLSITSKGLGPIIYNYSDLFMLDITSDDLAMMLRLLSGLIIPFVIISQFTLSIFSFFFNSLFLLLLGNLLRTVTGLGLKLKQVYHMVIYAMTFSVFWTHFTTLLPAPVPIWLDNFVYFAIPSMILISVFMTIRQKAMDEFNRKKDHR